MDSLSKTRLLQRLAIGFGVAGLGAVLAWHALRPDAPSAPEDEFAESILASRPGEIGADQREHLRQQWESFPPETRARLFRTVAKARLEDLRAETAALTPAERTARLRQALQDLQRRRQQLSPAERERVQRRLQDPQTRELVTQVMSFYREELTARERAELDPLVQEWLIQIERLGGRR